MRMTVVGTGYLGATHAACMAELGHDVLGVDVDQAKVDSLNAGEVPFYEPGLPELLQRGLTSGKLRFTTDYREAAEFANVHFIGVGTPQRKGSYVADTRYVRAVIDSLVPLMRGEHVILGKSTVPVGTADELQRRADKLVGPSASCTIAWNPEFLREGKAVRDTLQPDRIVLGTRAERSTSTGIAQLTRQMRTKQASKGAFPKAKTLRAEGAENDPDIEALVREIYAQPIAEGSPLLTMDLATTELVKVSANAFLATKISFINAVSEICETTGADVMALADAIGMDKRIGRQFLGAGLGFGGGCLPKDIRAFRARAGELGADEALTFLREVDAINMRRREKLVELAKAVLDGSVMGKSITVLGAAFKPDSDDVRDSPALAVAGALSLAGAAVTVYDPQAMVNAKKVFPTLDYAPTCEEALDDADLVILATEWKQFQELDPVDAVGRVASGKNGEQPALIDGRNCLDRERWEAAGWRVFNLGRG